MANEKNFTPELLEKAKSATSAAALLALAQESGITLTDEEATTYFAQLHPKAGELSDEELDNVSGGCDSSKLTRETQFRYVFAKYCYRNPSCRASHTEVEEAKRLQKLCYGCGCKALIDAYCRSRNWPIFECATNRQ